MILPLKFFEKIGDIIYSWHQKLFWLSEERNAIFGDIILNGQI